MSNQWTKPIGRGRAPDFRCLGIRRGAWALCLVLGLIVSASSAWAAEIVEVRVGRHPTFTRVVFELDRAAGYRVERSDPNADAAELIVSFQATSDPVRIKAWKKLVKDVQVAPSGGRSVARIRLAKEGLRLKEMILASPPRIVLDVISDQPAPAPIARTKPKAKPTPRPAPTVTKSPPVREESSFDDVVAQIPVEPEVVKPAPVVRPEPEPEPAVVEVVEIEEPEPVVEPEPEPEPEVVVVDEPSTSMPVEEPPVELTDVEIPVSDPDDSEMTEAEADALVAARMAEAEAEANALLESEFDDAAGLAGDGVAEPTPPAMPEPERRPMMVAESEDSGSGWMTWVLAGVAGLVVLIGGLIVVRGRSGSEEVDFGEDGTIDFGDSADAGQVQQDDAPISASDDNPFAGLAGDDQQMTLGGPDDTTVSPMNHADEDDTTVVPTSADDEKESESVVFDDSEENAMDDMEVISREQVNESLGGSMPPVGGVPEEFQQMMREMARRVEALEGRCDELVDARDRLERQVAAQTEELRVQRAAIARTQRAVRNLARPEDAVEEEATEPALRDPNKPSSSE